MANSLRADNYKFANEAGVTASEQTEAYPVGGARGYSVLIKLTDNGSTAGNVSLRYGLSENDLVLDPSTTTAMSFTANEQSILLNVNLPHYKYFDVDFEVTAGNLDYEVYVTVIEGDQ